MPVLQHPCGDLFLLLGPRSDSLAAASRCRLRPLSPETDANKRNGGEPSLKEETCDVFPFSLFLCEQQQRGGQTQRR